MLFYTHLLMGITLFLIIKNYFNFFSVPFSFSNDLVFFLAILLGSILPDLDERESKMKQMSGVIGMITVLLVKHRGIFHSLLMALFLFAMVWFWNVQFAFGLLFGYLTHLFGDGLTLMGIAPFYPLSKWKMKGPVKVGGFGEWFIAVLLIGAVIKLFFF